MPVVYALHIAAGSLGLILGFTALYSAKGGVVHRRSGILFVLVMLSMATLGMTLAIVRNKLPDVNIAAGLLVSYLVITALATVRPASPESRSRWWLHVVGMFVAATVGATMLAFALEAVASGGRRNGIPAFPYFLFTTFALLGVIGDLRVLRAGAPTGTPRLVRHLWRMSVALLIATLSTGQLARFIPEPYRFRPLFFGPVLVVAVTLLYWMWRIRFRRSLRGILLRSHGPVPVGGD